VIQRAALALLILCLASPTWADDRIELESGRVLEGEILREEKAWVGIDTGEGTVWVKREEIKSLTREEPAPERETPPPTEDPTPIVQEPGPDSTGRSKAGTPPAPVDRTAHPAPDTASPEEAERRSAESERLIKALCSGDRERRVGAVEWIVDTWPKWRETVKFALRESEDEAPRLEAVRLLDDERITGSLPLVEIALDDKSHKVRAAALRVARHRGFADIEKRAVDLMRSDPTWMVRQEAIRTLEDIGSDMCLPHVMAAWSGETDRDRKRRYRRVMKALLGEDFGDDATAWYRAADELFMGYRELRKGKKGAADKTR
jgi:hypothetical protein